MHLVICATPNEPLEDAPRTALVAEQDDGGCWDGFWATVSGDYYVRRTCVTGEMEWYQIADETPEPSSRSDARMLPFRPRAPLFRVSAILTRAPDGRRMLVGSAGRTTRR